MTRPQVSIRLGTDGKAQVERDFADLGESGDASAKRIGMAYERAADQADAALAKLAKAQQRLAAVAPSGSGPSNLINPITGGSYAQADGAAQASARSMAQQMEQGEAAARRLLAAIDPLYAAQLRYDTALAEANMLQRQGSLTSAQLAQVQAGLKNELNQQIGLYGGVAKGAGNSRIAQMELMHVVRGSVDQYAAGAPVAQIFAMHVGMLAQTAQLAGGSMGALGAFLSTGWGVAVTIGVAVLGPMIVKLIGAGDEVDNLVGKLKKEAAQAALNDQAHRVFANTLEGVQDALKKNAEALKGLDEQERSAATRALTAALAAKTRAQNILNETEANLALARSLYEVQKARASGPGQRGELAALGLPQAFGNLDFQQTQLAAARAALIGADEQIANATARVFAEAAGKEGVERIKAHYKTLIDEATKRATQEAAAARAAGDQAKAQALVTIEIQKQVVALNRKRDAEVKAWQDAHKEGPANAGGTAIFDAQIGAFFDTAAKYRGLSEHGDKSALEALFREGHMALDPEKVKWCAAFVNAVLATNGVTGTGSLAAKSFLNFGKDDMHSPQKGDIVVLRTAVGDHVGFYESGDKQGNVRVLAGNTSDKVGSATYSKNQVLAIRRPPTPSESASADDKAAAAADKAAEEALRAQGAFDDQRARLNEQLLRELGKVALGYEAQATVQLAVAQAEHDAEATKIANNLAQNKYGEATDKLAQSRAAELVTANDALLLQKKAAIALADYLKFLDTTQITADRKYEYQIEDLKFADEGARTAKEHRALQLQMLDIQYQQRKYDLETLKAKQQLAGEFAKAAETQAAIDRLPTDKAHDTARVNRSTMSPWDEYLKSLPQSAAELNEALEKIGVSGLQKLNDGLADALLKSKSLSDLWHNLGGVFHDLANQILADLLRLAEQEAMMALFGGKSQQPGGASASGGGIAGILGTIGSALGSIFGGGGGAGSGVSGKAFATGTEYAPGGAAWVGEHGPEMVRLPRGSKVFTAAESRRMAANDAGPTIGNITINGDFRGADQSAVASINAKLGQLKEELPGIIVSTMTDARQRFIWR